MWFLFSADAVAVIHFLFVVFVLFGAFLVLAWPKAIWLHAPALMWGLVVECTGTECPLTPLENHLRVLSGESGYAEDFLSHWLRTVLYPESLTRGHQIAMGASLLLLNAGLYLWIIRRHRHQSGTSSILA